MPDSVEPSDGEHESQQPASRSHKRVDASRKGVSSNKRAAGGAATRSAPARKRQKAKQTSSTAHAANVNIFLATAQKELQSKQKGNASAAKKPYGWVHEHWTPNLPAYLRELGDTITPDTWKQWNLTR